MSLKVLTISQINEYIQMLMDQDSLLSGIAIKGEISNYKVYPSGHHYFTLKDEGSALKCVMFRGNALRLKFQPGNGMKIIAMGKISVYPRDGIYQLYCSALMPDGVGDLYVAFEQMKAKLAAEGLFDSDHKKKRPEFPEIIGIVTSEAGAAIHDMLRILRKRYPLTKVRLFPVRVQGVEAPTEIANAIAYANKYALADLLIVGRGGGSIEDLWAFNDELVARAIYGSQIPVISAVGHEPDITISDYVADMRAATPSNAAELAVPDQDSLRQHLDSMLSVITTSVLRQLKASKQQLHALSTNSALQNPLKYVNSRYDFLKLLSTRLLAAHCDCINQKKQQFIALTAKLDVMSPLKVLTRGYAMLQNTDGSIIRSVHQLSSSEAVMITLSDGSATATINDIKETANEQ